MTGGYPAPTFADSSLRSHIWWTVLLRGVLTVVFGIVALVAPAAALTGIAVVFGAWVLVDGVSTVALAIRLRRVDKRWPWLLLQGIVSVLAGAATLVFPTVAGILGGLVVLWTIIVYAIMHGAAGLVSAAGAGDGPAKRAGIGSGVLTLVFGVVFAIVVLLAPDATLLGLAWTVGAWAIVFGAMLVVTAVQLRRGSAPLRSM